MDIEYANDNLERLAFDEDYTMGLPPQVAKKYRDRIALILGAPNEQVFRALQGSLDYKKLKGAKDNEKQMRLNRTHRIRMHVIDRGEGPIARINGAGDFHDG